VAHRNDHHWRRQRAPRRGSLRRHRHQELRTVIATHQATRYVVPLKEGGSLPAVLDTEEGGLFVAKFRGAGHGARALVAELVVGRLALALGLPVPELALITLDESFGRSERDPEIQDILKGSRGLNVGLRYLEGAFSFDPLADRVESALASRIVWLDALTTNLDRTAKSPNLMWWHGRLWLIDHGSALYFHHNWAGVDEKKARDPFTAIRDHVLLEAAGELTEADPELAATLTPEVVDEAIDAVPDALLMDAPPGVEPPFPTAGENRDAYRRYFTSRLTGPRPFLETAIKARQELRLSPSRRQGYRR
jgi:hypothetical protein